jgi:hypothetical protein
MRWMSTFAVVSLLAGCASNSAAEGPRPPVKLGEPDTDVDPEMIGEAVRRSSARFQHCFQTARERNPSLSGLIEVRFLINSDGTVGKAMAAETDLPTPVATCVVDVFYDLKLPAQQNAVIAQYPMYFQPG